MSAGGKCAVLAVAATALGACGDNLTGDIAAQLAVLPGVTVEPMPTSVPYAHYYQLTFDEPIDHANPGLGTFPLHVALTHRATGAPLVALTSGYFDYYRDQQFEVTDLVFGNQASIEHRFYGASVPAGLATNPALWRYLTIDQMAADEHDVVTALQTIETGPTIATGGSKGGMTALFYRRFFPDDVDATVAYVAPFSFGAPDPRYVDFLLGVGDATCRAAVRAVAVEMLAHRRAALEQRAQDQAALRGYTYTRISLPAAVESSVTVLEFQFWQYYGESNCDRVPAPTASDDELWRFLVAVAAVSDSDDDQTAAFAPYVYQAYAQLGYPDVGLDYLEPYLMFTDADYVGALPTAQPAYDDGGAMRDVDEWVRAHATETLAIYGQWDPWTAGAITLPAGSPTFVAAAGTHNSRLRDLPAADREAAATALSAWTHTDPALRPVGEAEQARAAESATPEPRIPPAVRRALARSHR